jgi:opacity protein-like surface antigen
VKRRGSGLLAAAGLAASLTAQDSASAGDFALTLEAGLRTMSNSPDTEKAIFDEESGLGAGLGLSYDRGPHWRFGVDARRIKRDGERAFAAERASEAFRLGHPLALTMTQTLASVAYRFGRVGPVSPYLGVGAGVVSWREESNIAGLVENASGTTGVFEGRLGIERQQGPVRLALEGGITFAKNAVGAGGISKVYEENDLGGLFVVGKIGFSRK